jgi:hypothetical protein
MSSERDMQGKKIRDTVGAIRLRARIGRISWRDLALTLGPILLISVAAIWATFWFVRPAPPHTIVITSGPEGSTFRRSAERYRTILARNGVTLEILPSDGAVENLKRLSDPAFRVDVGFVQGGLTAGVDISDLVSLGSVFYEPLTVFYRGATPMQRLSRLSGKRIAVGAPGSGTHALAVTLLKANGIEESGTAKLLPLGGDDAVRAILAGEVDAAFLAGDSATGANMRKLLAAPGVHLLDFVQAEAYVRRFPYLSKLQLPGGSIDLGKNLPRMPLTLIAPTVELIARRDLHPALSGLLIDAAREVHSRATLIQKAREFPAPLEHEFPIGDDAARYYTSGKGFLYRHLPFWVASLLDRTVLLLIPVIVLLIPGLRVVPTLYGWRIRSRIYRRYGELMALERETFIPFTAEQREELLRRLAAFDKAVINSKIPGAYANELYVLREHARFVRDRLNEPLAQS